MLPSNGSHRSGSGVDWKRLLAAVAEAQRTTLLQLSGINVTSAMARTAFNEVRESQRAAAKKEKGSSSSKGTGSSSKEWARREAYAGRRVRRGREGGRGGGGGSRDSRGMGRGRGETEREVAERNLRAFDQVKYVRRDEFRVVGETG